MGRTLRIALPKIARTDRTPQDVTILPRKEVEAAGIGSRVEDGAEVDEEEAMAPPSRENNDIRVSGDLNADVGGRCDPFPFSLGP
jgi:hypothetical protein